MQRQAAYLCVAILLVGGPILATCVSVEYANDTEAFRALNWDEEANKLLQMIRSYETCNIKFVTSDKSGEVLIAFRPSCEKKAIKAASSSRSLVDDTIKCVVAFVENFTGLKFSIPRVCCGLGFPLNLIFAVLCHPSSPISRSMIQSGSTPFTDDQPPTEAGFDYY